MGKKKILLIGASSLLGKALVDLFHDVYEIFGTYSQKELSQSSYKHIKQIKLDITRPHQLKKVFQAHKYDVVIHVASIGNIECCEQNKKRAKAVNFTATKHIVALTKLIRAKLIFISSSAVFAGISASYFEDSKREPINFYGKMKQLSEDVVLKEKKNAVMRVTMMYGWNNPSERSNTVTWIIESAKNGKQITLANDRFTNPVWNYEVAKSIKSVIEKNLCGCFHVAGLNTLNRYEIAQAVCKEFDLDSKYIKSKQYMHLHQVSRHGLQETLDTSNMVEKIHQIPISFEEGLRKMRKEGFHD
ncbi:MAG: sugar nucleotide-binding protein [Patescibacteria group bacterium]|mgnify:CR=1 FL=1